MHAGRLERVLSSISAGLLFAMMLLVTADVAGRYLFSAPIAGSFEITEFMLAILVFSSIPAVTREDAHISVSLVEGVLKGRAKRVHRLGMLAIGALALGLIAWRMWLGGDKLAAGRQVTGYLELPRAPLAYAMSVLAAIAFLTALAMAWRELRRPGAG